MTTTTITLFALSQGFLALLIGLLLGVVLRDEDEGGGEE